MPSKKDDRSRFRFDGFAGFEEPGVTMVPDAFFDQLAPALTEAELRVLLYIIRRTYGFKKKDDDISLKQMVEGIIKKDGVILDRGAGVAKSAAVRAVKGLVEKQIIEATRNWSPQKGDEPTTYRLRFKNSGLDASSSGPVFSKRTRGGPPSGHGGVLQENTQETVRQETVQQQDDDDIRGALEAFGISGGQAQRLAEMYPPTLILEKLDQVSYLVERRSSLVSRNPQGFLIKAIEENYLPEKPKGYKTKAERDAQAQQRQAQEAELERARLDREQTIAAYKQHQQPKPIPGTTLTTATSWEQTLATLQGQMTAANFNMWLKQTVLVDCRDGQALIAAPSTFVAEWLQARMVPIVKRALVETLGQPVELQFTVAADLTPPGE